MWHKSHSPLSGKIGLWYYILCTFLSGRDIKFDGVENARQRRTRHVLFLKYPEIFMPPTTMTMPSNGHLKKLFCLYLIISRILSIFVAYLRFNLI